jgi:hypothetical protein
MEDEPAARGVSIGAILVGIVLVVSAAGAIGWYWMTNRKGLELNVTGFDVNAVSPQAAPVFSRDGGEIQTQDSMLIKAEKGMRFDDGVDASASSQPGSSGGQGSRAGFSSDVRRYEAQVRDFAIKMTRKYPSVRQYGKDWMGYGDLHKLNDEYMRNHDPMAFMVGLSHSPNFGKLIGKYGNDAGIRAFVVEGIKQAPPELVATAGDALRGDSTVKNLVNNVGQSLGLPPSALAVMNGGQVNQSQAMSDAANAPALRGANSSH